ncbi:hypothetical protein LVD15_21160 [Fulvivirga maritima]|uniref:CheR family methyltransferase n=1 Tax=Fulvivirga maritima TaxID=2904247 RepID=UPI001F390C25|nr:CheR family methyltransferase [Fulvivirga maritima]UII25787.1 hypothetical protein LVD15_21160 [Fulvivirga maritima]
MSHPTAIDMNNDQNLLIVGIGASAGGLKALQQLFETIPSDLPIAYFIIQHLDPNHKSLLSELISKKTPLTVADATTNTTIQKGHVYVIPPGKYLEIKNNKINLVDKKEMSGSRMAIDHFFKSIAYHCEERCVGIVLSGSGSDGTAGLREIKAVGGLTLAQMPQSADHPSMPNSAIDAGAIDKVAELDEIPKIIKNYLTHPLTLKKENQIQRSFSNDVLDKVAKILSEHEKFYLSQYKPNTIYRRLTRRMSLTGIEDYEQYIKELEKNAEERKQLSEDLLINVTDFFRDKEAYQTLNEEVIPEIIKNIEKDQPIRIWIAGCASGEEAYSLAICFLEQMAKENINNELQIFATDIDDNAIKIARKGIYPASIIKEVPPQYIQKYFVKKEHDFYQIKGIVRDLISFAKQNVATNPPFSHMHLISCRNLLIYMRKEIQEKILNAFYFALERDSYLFLGSSETISNKTDFFRSIS